MSKGKGKLQVIPKFNAYKERFELESKNTIEPGLDAIKRALVKVGNPHHNLKFIHVAGTNGKGSTISMMNAMLQAHGVKTGCFYSPCFMDVHDQIQLNGEFISPDQLDHAFNRAKIAGLSGMLTDFELLTVIAFLAFDHFKPDIVLLETGMGGRYDSTNVIDPLISVIPSIALEHEQFLGTTLKEVATHKAGIIKAGKPIVIGSLEEDAHETILEEAKLVGSQVWEIKQDFALGESRYQDGENDLKHLTVPLHGAHQIDNAALAIRTVIYVLKELNITMSEDNLRKGLSEAFIPGRFEKIAENLYFDGAHNPASARALVETVKFLFPHTPIHFYIGMIKGKDTKKILSIFEEISSNFTFVDFQDERSMSSQDLSKISSSPTINVTKEPLKNLQRTISKKHVTIVSGSLYLLAELRFQAIKMFEII